MSKAKRRLVDRTRNAEVQDCRDRERGSLSLHVTAAETGRFLAAAQASGEAPPPVWVPVGFTTFPGEVLAAPRSWVEMVYPGLAYFNEVDRGGHFVAWEEPELSSDEVRAAFRSLR